MILNGKIVYEKYPRMRPVDKHIWWSVSKSVAGTIVGLLEEQGKVDVTRPIETYIPRLAETGWKGTPQCIKQRCLCNDSVGIVV